MQLENAKALEFKECQLNNEVSTKLFEARNKVSPDNLRKLRIDVMERIYKKLKISVVDLVSYSPEKIGDARCLLPGLGQVFKQE